jgi:hypothetical protein
LEVLSKNSWVSGTQSDGDSREHDGVFASIGRSYAAYQILTDWTDSVDQPIPKQSEMVEVPKAAAISKPGDFTEQLLDFAQRLIGLQLMFVMNLIEAVTGQT